MAQRNEITGRGGGSVGTYMKLDPQLSGLSGGICNTPWSTPAVPTALYPGTPVSWGS